MAEFKLTNKAVDDLSKIWDYTFEVWSERQADNYYQALISNCQEIADHSDPGKNSATCLLAGWSRSFRNRLGHCRYTTFKCTSRHQHRCSLKNLIKRSCYNPFKIS